MASKPRFHDTKQPQKHTKEKREGRRERGEEKRTPGTHNFYIAYFGNTFCAKKKRARDPLVPSKTLLD